MKLSNDVVFRVVGDEAVVLKVKEGEVIGVNRVGALVLTELKTGAALDAIVAKVVAAHGVDATLARTDVMSFLDSLREAGVLVE